MSVSDKSIKIMAVGDERVGKTCLLLSYKDKKYPDTSWLPIVCYTYDKTVPIGENVYIISLWDTATVDDYDILRPVYYPGTDIFLVCFAVHLRDSFENIQKKWVPEVRKYDRHAKIILVGTQTDLRNSDSVTEEEGRQMQEKLNLDKYVECSALRMENVDKVFDEAAATYILNQRKKKKQNYCVYL